MKVNFLNTLVLGVTLSISSLSNAGMISFTSNPASNSTDWEAKALELGLLVNSDMNFDTMSTGLLDNNFYSGIGVTFDTVGDVNTVDNGEGPGQGNTGGSILGEGLHVASNYLFDGQEPSQLTVNFNDAVWGVGLSVVDYFNPSDNNPLTIEAYTGIGGTGVLLGSFSSVAENFQRNNMYFMGLMSTEKNIRSFVFKDVNNTTGDTIGIDNIVFAFDEGQVTDVPEPSTLAILALGIMGLASRRFKKLP